MERTEADWYLLNARKMDAHGVFHVTNKQAKKYAKLKVEELESQHPKPEPYAYLVDDDYFDRDTYKEMVSKKVISVENDKIIPLYREPVHPNPTQTPEEIFKILRENKVGHAKAHYIKNEILALGQSKPTVTDEDRRCLSIDPDEDEDEFN